MKSAKTQLTRHSKGLRMACGILPFAVALTLAAPASSDIPPVGELREEYAKATHDANESKRFYEKMKATKGSSNPIMIGYRGLSAVLMAKHASFPTTKLGYFKEGISDLDSAIDRSSTNPELRFLRLSIQENSPGVADYDEDLKEDRQIVLDFLRRERCKGDRDLQLRMADYFLKESKDTQKELPQLIDVAREVRTCS